VYSEGVNPSLPSQALEALGVEGHDGAELIELVLGELFFGAQVE